MTGLTDGQVEGLINLFAPPSVAAGIKMATSQLKLNSPDIILKAGLTKLGVKDDTTATKLLGLMRSHAPSTDMTVMDFLKSPEFSRLLTGSDPESTALAVCPHCGEFLVS